MVGAGATAQHNWDAELAAIAEQMKAAPAEVGLIAAQHAQGLFGSVELSILAKMKRSGVSERDGHSMK